MHHVIFVETAKAPATLQLVRQDPACMARMSASVLPRGERLEVVVADIRAFFDSQYFSLRAPISFSRIAVAAAVMLCAAWWLLDAALFIGVAFATMCFVGSSYGYYHAIDGKLERLVYIQQVEQLPLEAELDGLFEYLPVGTLITGAPPRKSPHED